MNSALLRIPLYRYRVPVSMGTFTTSSSVTALLTLLATLEDDDEEATPFPPAGGGGLFLWFGKVGTAGRGGGAKGASAAGGSCRFLLAVRCSLADAFKFLLWEESEAAFES
jgi:hypothetical protein